MKRRAHRYREAFMEGGYEYVRTLDIGAQALRRWREISAKVKHLPDDPSARKKIVKLFGEACVKVGLPIAIVRPVGRSHCLFRVTRIRAYCCTTNEHVCWPDDTQFVVEAIEAAEQALAKSFIE